MDLKRTKRLKEDYTALRDRIRPLQDALRVIVLDRRANAPKLVSTPVLLLVGGVFSMMVTIEQGYLSQFDAAFSAITSSMKELASSEGAKPSVRQTGFQALVNLLRLISVRHMEIRAANVNKEIALSVYQLINAMNTLLSGQRRTNVIDNIKTAAECLKGMISAVRNTIPARVGPEINEADGKQLLDNALSTVRM